MFRERFSEGRRRDCSGEKERTSQSLRNRESTATAKVREEEVDLTCDVVEMFGEERWDGE